MTVVLESNARNAAIDAVAGLLDLGTIKFETSGDVEVATCTFGATAFGAGAAGVATANAITDDSSATGGVIAQASFYTSGAAKVLECSVGTSGEDINITSLTIGVGDTVSITALTITQPA